MQEDAVTLSQGPVVWRTRGLSANDDVHLVHCVVIGERDMHAAALEQSAREDLDSGLCSPVSSPLSRAAHADRLS
jgi:hypothetical protein